MQYFIIIFLKDTLAKNKLEKERWMLWGNKNHKQMG